MRQPRFITLEGGEAAGKSTQVRRLADALSARGLPVLTTREPGGAPGSERLRELLLGGNVEWSPCAEILLHFAARADHVEKTIRPALGAGTWVICDRYTDSTMAYQGYGQGGDRALIAELGRVIGLAPDITLVLDVTGPEAARRLEKRGGLDRYERLDGEFHQRVRAGFRAIARDNPDRCALVPADGSVDEVHSAIVTALDRKFPI